MKSLAPYAIPLIVELLMLPLPATDPETWVPWPNMSSPLELSLHPVKVNLLGLHQALMFTTRPRKSGFRVERFPVSRPVSVTVTIVLLPFSPSLDQTSLAP